ncbi:MAG: zinc ABC transporter substrate-binding protein [Burkholderia sp.]|nr:zinc ABC transporter substrate-binding protein [Burkholderia sp.]
MTISLSRFSLYNGFSPSYRYSPVHSNNIWLPRSESFLFFFWLRIFILLAFFSFSGCTFSMPVNIVAAENFYGDLAKQIGGKHVVITSILNNPNQDPHLFEASPKTARALHDAQIVIYNGANYDPWVSRLLSASKKPERRVLIVANLIGKKTGDNPHLWYKPETMLTVACAFDEELSRIDPEHKAEFDANLIRFIESLKPFFEKISAIRIKYHGQPITSTEPIADYLVDALGLKMHNKRFQIATMNSTEARLSDIAAFEKDLRNHLVRALIYNSQTEEPMTKQMLKIAHNAHIPIVSVTETQPENKTFQQWQFEQLEALEYALGTSSNRLFQTQ